MNRVAMAGATCPCKLQNSTVAMLAADDCALRADRNRVSCGYRAAGESQASVAAGNVLGTMRKWLASNGFFPR